MRDHHEQQEKPVGSLCLTTGQKWPFYGACLAVLTLMSAMSYRNAEALQLHKHSISQNSPPGLQLFMDAMHPASTRPTTRGRKPLQAYEAVL